MTPINRRPTRPGVEPPRNAGHTGRWLNPTAYTTTRHLDRPFTVDDVRRLWQHDVDRLRRRFRAALAVIAVIAVAVAVLVAVTAAPTRSALRCAPAAPATAVTP